MLYNQTKSYIEMTLQNNRRLHTLIDARHMWGETYYDVVEWTKRKTKTNLLTNCCEGRASVEVWRHLKIIGNTLQFVTENKIVLEYCKNNLEFERGQPRLTCNRDKIRHPRRLTSTDTA